MAKAVNCSNIQKNGDPCEKCETCTMFQEGKLIDVIEIDAASNTWVDNIRELIDQARFAPTYAKHKIYIIDEVHMLSKGAFNALLKILEEPPEHVIFILATTEVQKVPDTILSRTLRFDLLKFTQKQLTDHLNWIANEENLVTDDKALEVIVRAAKGGMRDAISLFEQFSTNGDVTYEAVKDQLRLADVDFLDHVFALLVRWNISEMNDALWLLLQQGWDPKFFLEEWIGHVLRKCIESVGTKGYDVCHKVYSYFSDVYGRLRVSPDGWSLVQLWFLEMTHTYHKEPLWDWAIEKEGGVPVGANNHSPEWRSSTSIEANNHTSEWESSTHKETDNVSPEKWKRETVEETDAQVDVKDLPKWENKAPEDTNNQSSEWSSDTKENVSRKNTDTTVNSSSTEVRSQKPETTNDEWVITSDSWPGDTSFSKEQFIRELKKIPEIPTSIIATLRAAPMKANGDHLNIEVSQYHLTRISWGDIGQKIQFCCEESFGLITEFAAMKPVKADEADSLFS